MPALVPEIFKVWKTCKLCKWDDLWCHTLNPILQYLFEYSYLGQFAAQIIETWHANRPIENTHFAAMATDSFPVPTSLISICKWFSYRKTLYEATNSSFDMYMRVGSCISVTICKYENWMQRVARNTFNIGEVCQYVAMGIKLLRPNCRAHLVESYCKEWNISDTNWLRYLFSSYLIKTWLSIWRHH